MDRKSKMDVIKKIQDLMALAQDQEGMPEGELAAQKVREIMHKHAITMEQITADGEDEEELCSEKWPMPKKTTWRQSLLGIICEHCDCRLFCYTGTNVHHIFGFSSNVKLALYLFTVVERQLQSMATTYYQDQLTPQIREGDLSRGDARRSQIDFLVTAISALQDRFRKMRKRQSKADPRGHMLIVRRLEKVDAFFARMRQKLKIKNVDDYCREFNSSGYKAGWEVAVAGGGGLDESPQKPPKALLQKGKR